MASSKTRLQKICAANYWKQPSFECSEQGPGHKKMFTVKVNIEVKLLDSNTDLECWGSPQSKKKTAEQEAAEAALWYLKQLGYH